MSNQEQLHGSIERVIFSSQENGFTVCLLKVSAHELVTIAGALPSVNAGEQVAVKGSWDYHAKFGRQFKVVEFSRQLPSSVVGIRKYLSSGLIKGIGPKFAERLVDHFGDQTLEVIDTSPQRLSEVSGIGHSRIQSITQAWHDQKEISKVMLFLKERDVSTAFAAKIYKTYGQQSLEKIQENPYRLVEDIWGVGFKSADQLALKLGFKPDSLYRICAGIVYSITEEIGNGNLYAKIDEVKEKTDKILGLTEHPEKKELLSQGLRQLYQRENIKLISDKNEHFITLPQYYFSEKNIAKKILWLQSKPAGLAHLDAHTLYDQVRKADERGIQLNDDQQRGIMATLQNKVTIITGGPGTGKTTLVKKLLEVLDSNNVCFRLAAPTGRAAKRMFEGTGKNTATLHRLLKFDPGIMGFFHNERNALDLEFLIIDEASMIDVFLMYAVLKALPEKAHLLFLGDVDQLPSVGAGNVLNDLIASDKIMVVRLTQIFRQAQDSLIVVNAHRVNNGEFPISFQEGSKRDFGIIKELEPANTFVHLRTLYEKKLPKLGISAKETVVLVPMNRGIVGSQRVNHELQQILNPAGDPQKQIARFGTVYKIGDRVMQIRNNYDKFVFNGDMGHIIDIICQEHKVMISFDTRVLCYDYTELSQIVLSYAISIHKSQGSEFQAVIIPVFMQHFILLQRNLLYTAITRAKKMCILLGQPKAIALGISNNKGVERTTFLQEFLTTNLCAR